ncbi:hypothetical protein [Anaerovibrio lipolyticus]|nr:hypothetical protein [Anaerovibrio lipolyticus]
MGADALYFKICVQLQPRLAGGSREGELAGKTGQLSIRCGYRTLTCQSL